MSAHRRIGLAAMLVVAGLAAAMLVIRPGPRALADPTQALLAGAYDPPRAAPDFMLLGSQDRRVTLTQYRAKVVLLTFGFTYCASVCPTTLATLAQARKLLGAKAEDVQVLFVTVDPARDTVSNMKTYLAAFDPSFVGATGDPTALAKVREDYGVTATKEGSGPDYAMAHTSSIFIIDRAGRLRAMMPFGRQATDFAHDVALLLGE